MAAGAHRILTEISFVEQGDIFLRVGEYKNFFGVTPNGTIHRRCFTLRHYGDPTIHEGRCDLFFLLTFEKLAI
jgi:hypothetical protein